MHCRRLQAGWIRLAPAAVWLLAIAPAIGTAPPALAGAFPADMAGLEAWAADATAHALQAAEPGNNAAAGLREVMNRGASLGVLGLQQLGPGWLQRFSFDLEFQDDLRARYDIGATQPLLRSWRHGDLLWLRGRLAHAPDGPFAAELGLHYRPAVPRRDLTLSLGGLIEDHGPLDFQRYGVVAALRAPGLEASGRLFDDVADSGPPGGGIADRRLDGYDLALRARVPRLPWAWVRARKRWQVAVDSTAATTSDELGLQLRPLAPLEVEAGISDNGARSDWYTRLRFTLQLGGG